MTQPPPPPIPPEEPPLGEPPAEEPPSGEPEPGGPPAKRGLSGCAKAAIIGGIVVVIGIVGLAAWVGVSLNR